MWAGGRYSGEYHGELSHIHTWSSYVQYGHQPANAYDMWLNMGTDPSYTIEESNLVTDWSPNVFKVHGNVFRRFPGSTLSLRCGQPEVPTNPTPCQESSFSAVVVDQVIPITFIEQAFPVRNFRSGGY